MDVNLELDIDKLVGTGKEMTRRARNLKPVFRDLSGLLKDDIDETFRLRTGPQEKWPKLSDATRARRKRKGKKRGPAASRLGRIRKAFYLDVGRHHLIATSKVDWAEVHQFGGRAGPGGRSEIPQRMHLYLSNEFIARAIDKISDYVAKGRR